MRPVKFILTGDHGGGLPPTQATDGSAGFDLFSAEKVEFEPGQYERVACGIAMEIPEGYCGLVLPRSGLVLKKGLTVANAPGLIDSDYRGEVCVMLHNISARDQFVSAGDRIAQMVFVQFGAPPMLQVANLSPTERGVGGFGSTGQ